MFCSVSSRSMFSYTSDAKLTWLPMELYLLVGDLLLLNESALLSRYMSVRFGSWCGWPYFSEAVVAVAAAGESGYFTFGG